VFYNPIYVNKTKMTYKSLFALLWSESHFLFSPLEKLQSKFKRVSLVSLNGLQGLFGVTNAYLRVLNF
jgi:hypothetical protein